MVHNLWAGHLQEHLVATAMLNEEILRMLEYRFIPTWHNIIVHYGALLFHHKKHEDFEVLVTTLFYQCDQAESHLLLLAEIFAACGVKDSEPWIGVDLREILFFNQGDYYTDHHLERLNRIGQMDPEWFVERQMNELSEEDIEFFEEEPFPYFHFFHFGRDPESPFMLIEQTKSAYSRKILKNHFWGDDLKLAFLSVAAYSKFATHSDLDLIKSILDKNDPSDPQFMRCLCFSLCSGHASLSPYVIQFKDAWWSNHRFRDFVISEIPNRGNRTAYDILFELATIAITQADSEEAITELLEWLARLGGPISIAKFDALLDLTEDKKISSQLQKRKIEAGAIQSEAVLEALKSEETALKFIDALSGAVLNGHYPNKSVIEKIKSLDPDLVDQSILNLTHIEDAATEIGTSTGLLPIILSSCERLYKKFDLGEVNLDVVETTFSLSFDVFSKARYKDAASLALQCMDRFPSSERIMNNALTLIGHVYKGTDDQVLLDRIEPFAIEDEIDLRHSALEAIARISPERANLLGSYAISKIVFEMLAESHEWLLFERFWVKEFGQKKFYKNVPRKLAAHINPYNEDTFSLLRQVGSLLADQYIRYDLNPKDITKPGLVFHTVADNLDEFVPGLDEECLRQQYYLVCYPEEAEDFDDLQGAAVAHKDGIRRYLNKHNLSVTDKHLSHG